ITIKRTGEGGPHRKLGMERQHLIDRRGRMLRLWAPAEAKKPVNIQAVSEKRKSQNKDYTNVRNQFLIEHPRCQVRGCNKVSEEIHHRRGRTGDLLTDPKFFLAVCRDHHMEIEQDPVWAKEQGYSLSRLKK